MRLEKWLVALCAVLCASCIQLDATSWKAENPARKIVVADQEALLEALETDTGYDYSRRDRAVHLLELLLKETRDVHRRQEQVRWDLVALVLQEEPTATGPLIERFNAAMDNSVFAGYRGYDYAKRDEVSFIELQRTHMLCPACVEAWARNSSWPLHTAARHNWFGTASLLLVALGPEKAAQMCGRVTERGVGPMDVASTPMMKALLEQCGARAHSAEEQEAVREATRERYRAEDAERQYYDRLTEQRARELDAEARADREREARERVYRDRQEQADREEHIRQMGDLNMGLPMLNPGPAPMVMQGTGPELHEDSASPSADDPSSAAAGSSAALEGAGTSASAGSDRAVASGGGAITPSSSAASSSGAPGASTTPGSSSAGAGAGSAGSNAPSAARSGSYGNASPPIILTERSSAPPEETAEQRRRRLEDQAIVDRRLEAQAAAQRQADEEKRLRREREQERWRRAGPPCTSGCSKAK